MTSQTQTIILLFFLGTAGLMSCDPVHALYLENQTNHKILIQTEQGGQYDTLYSDSVIQIGNCVAHYEPRLEDVKIDYLKIISNSDTVVFPEKAVIASKLEKVGSLDWRIVYKDKSNR